MKWTEYFVEVCKFGFLTGLLIAWANSLLLAGKLSIQFSVYELNPVIVGIETVCLVVGVVGSVVRMWRIHNEQ